MKFSANFQPKFNGLVLGLWPTLQQTFMKIGAIRFEISWRQTDKQTDRQTNKQTDRQTNKHSFKKTYQEPCKI